MKVKATQSFGDAVSGATYMAGGEYDLADLYASELVNAGLLRDLTPPAPEQPKAAAPEEPKAHQPKAK